MSAQSLHALDQLGKFGEAGRSLQRFLTREDLRKHPVTGVYRRIAWRLRWQILKAPWPVLTKSGLPLLLPNSGTAALIYFQGSSEPELANFLKRFLKPKMVFVDVGANLGEYTIMAASLVRGIGKVHAFEACPGSFEVLTMNVELNKLENTVTNPLAVWDREGFLDFENAPDPSLSALRPAQTALQGGRISRVKSVTLDGYFADGRYGKPDLIKIDVEGAELQVLKGARSILSPLQAPDVIVEYGPRNAARFGYSAAEVCSFLRDQGYSLFQWVARMKLIPFVGEPYLPPQSDSCNLLATKNLARLASNFPGL